MKILCLLIFTAVGAWAQCGSVTLNPFTGLLDCVGSGGGAAAFSSLTSGTNTTAAMVIGTGASLTVSGSGTINATSLGGTAAASYALGAAGLTNANALVSVSSAGTLKEAVNASTAPSLILGGSALSGFPLTTKDTGGTARGGFRTADIMAAGAVELYHGTTPFPCCTNRSFYADEAGVILASGGVFSISSVAAGANDVVGSLDTGLSRISAAVVGLGNGTAGSVSGSLKFTQAIAAGSGPTVGAGSCTGATIGTGSTQMTGTITGTPTGTCTVTITFPVAATTGYSCAISNQTTANLIRQTASSTTVATFVGVTVANDVLRYGPCIAY